MCAIGLLRSADQSSMPDTFQRMWPVPLDCDARRGRNQFLVVGADIIGRRDSAQFGAAICDLLRLHILGWMFGDFALQIDVDKRRRESTQIARQCTDATGEQAETPMGRGDFCFGIRQDERAFLRIGQVAPDLITNFLAGFLRPAQKDPLALLVEVSSCDPRDLLLPPG